MDFCFGCIKDTPGISILIENNLVWILRKKMQEQIYKLSPYITKDDMNDEMRNYAAAFVSGAIIDIIVYLYNNNIQKSSKELSELVFHLLNGEYLRDFE